jgi:hypothetical protein
MLFTALEPRVGETQVQFPAGTELNRVSSKTRPAVGSTQLPVECIMTLLHSGNMVRHSLQCHIEIKNDRSFSSTVQYILMV